MDKAIYGRAPWIPKPLDATELIFSGQHDKQADATEFSALLLDWLQRELADGGSTKKEFPTLLE